MVLVAICAVLVVSCTNQSGPDSDNEPTSTAPSPGTTTADNDELEAALEQIRDLERQMEALEARAQAAEASLEAADRERDQGLADAEERVGCLQPFARAGAGEMVVTLFETCDRGVAGNNRVLAGLGPVGRVVPATDQPLLAALEALVAGTTSQETAEGYLSFFTPATAEAVLSVELNDGMAVIDLDGETITSLSNVSTSTGGSYFRGQLYGTVFANAAVNSVEFRLDGQSLAFCTLMELVFDCTPITRSEWSQEYTATFDD